MDMEQITIGNAVTDANRGWFVGSFFDPTLGLRHSDEVEVKWGIHKVGEVRAEWVTGEARTTLAVLVSGEWEMIFPDRTVVLSKPGDFVMWGKGVDHKWKARAETVLVTIRWPSIKSN